MKFTGVYDIFEEKIIQRTQKSLRKGTKKDGKGSEKACFAKKHEENRNMAEN